MPFYPENWKCVNLCILMISATFYCFLRFGPKSRKCAKSSILGPKKPSRTPLFCLLSEPAAPFAVSGPPFPDFPVIFVKVLHFNAFPSFLCFELKNAEWVFLRFRAKYTPETITFIRFWATFPQAWFFIIISFCGRDNIFCGISYSDRIFNFLGSSYFTKKTTSERHTFPSG